MSKVLFLLLIAVAARGQYFPLEVGNQWVYRLEGSPKAEPRIAEITGVESIDGVEYHVYRGIQGEIGRLRMTAENRLVARAGDGSEVVWVDFNAPERSNFPAQVADCTGPATVESRVQKLDLLGLTWSDGLSIAYGPGQCADAGVLTDLYLPGLGLARRVYQSFIGPRTYSLSYARIGKNTYSNEQDLAFRMSLSRSETSDATRLEVRFTLVNNTGVPIVLNYRSGQSYDWQVRNAEGKSFYTWSANKLFIAALRSETVIGEKNWTVAEHLTLPSGDYILDGYLTTGETPVYRAQLPFRVP